MITPQIQRNYAGDTITFTSKLGKLVLTECGLDPYDSNKLAPRVYEAAKHYISLHRGNATTMKKAELIRWYISVTDRMWNA